MNFALTPQQQAIVAHEGDLRINAVAGSGKTSTLLAYAKHHARDRILYLVFNRSARIEAQKRFADAALGNVTVETAHSLAFKGVIPGSGLNVAKNGYRRRDIRDMLAIRSVGHDPLSGFLLAHHVSALATLFCNSTAARVDDCDYLATLPPGEARDFATEHLDAITLYTRQFLAKMNAGTIEVSHEFYLKRFQLNAPRLNYGRILFDEGQDASPAMLDVFLRQNGTKVIVGDAHQQIYSWRHAVNALASVDFPELPLSASFRFGKNIADLAMEVLSWKTELDSSPQLRITGLGPGKTKTKLSATLARTNISLLRAAIGAVAGRRGGLSRIYFEGNLSSYAYAAEGASLYDVLNLYLGDATRIRDPFIASMGSFSALKDFADKAGDTELGTLGEIVEEYGKGLPAALARVKKCHVEDADKASAEMIFSTVHRCKGMEYDTVTLEDDFVSGRRIDDLLKKLREGDEEVDPARLAEEVNLAYVAVTRAQRSLYAPDDMFPNFKASHAPKRDAASAQPKRSSASWDDYLAKKRKASPSAYKPWSDAEDAALRKSFADGVPPAQIARQTGRSRGAVAARLMKLEGENG